VLERPQSPKWEAARDQELQQLEEYRVYEEVEHVPEGKQVVDPKWIFKQKEEEDWEDRKGSRLGSLPEDPYYSQELIVIRPMHQCVERRAGGSYS